MCLVLKDAVLDVAGHADVEDTALAGEDIYVVDLWHRLEHVRGLGSVQ